MQRYFFTLLLVSSLGFQACNHDPFVQPIDPGIPPIPVTGECDPDSVYFQNQILPILVSNCTLSGCHNTQDHMDGVILDSYQSLVSTVENATQNDFQENKLIRVLLETDPDKIMPRPPQAPLAQAQIDLLKAWVAQGALNNACDENFGGCDLVNVKYSNFVQPLIQSKCKGCHSGSNPQGNLALVTYNDVKTIALNGKLYTLLTQSSNWMPKGGAKLDNCSLQKIQSWVSVGAPEN